LEAAFAPDEAAEATPSAGAVPKTIRIKRPAAAAPSLRATKPSAAATAPGPSAAAAAEEETLPSPDIAAEKSKTSRVDLATVVPADSGQATQRKTIKIRRPEAGGATHAPRSVAVARIEAEAAQRQIEEAQPVNVAFPILAAVATVVICVLLYVLMAQSFPTLNWSFPGQVTL
jgi:cobalamin biosynthesis Mg chelatase CobN